MSWRITVVVTEKLNLSFHDEYLIEVIGREESGWRNTTNKSVYYLHIPSALKIMNVYIILYFNSRVI